MLSKQQLSPLLLLVTETAIKKGGVVWHTQGAGKSIEWHVLLDV